MGVDSPLHCWWGWDGRASVNKRVDKVGCSVSADGSASVLERRDTGSRNSRLQFTWWCNCRCPQRRPPRLEQGVPTDQHGFPQSPVTTASRDGNPVAAAGGVHSVDAVIIVVVVVVVVLLLFSPVVGIGSVATHTSAKRSIVTGAMWLHLMQQNISQSGISQPNVQC